MGRKKKFDSLIYQIWDTTSTFGSSTSRSPLSDGITTSRQQDDRETDKEAQSGTLDTLSAAATAANFVNK